MKVNCASDTKGKSSIKRTPALNVLLSNFVELSEKRFFSAKKHDFTKLDQEKTMVKSALLLRISFSITRAVHLCGPPQLVQ